jgi:uncharacterized protein YeaO (DUF488 family)
MLKIKRVYESYETSDGFRILVDRLWPRGVSKEKAHVDVWLKEIAPSTELRKWFNHDLSKWKEFQQKYKKELEINEMVKEMRKLEKKYPQITLLYAAKDELHNDAVVLLEYLT